MAYSGLISSFAVVAASFVFLFLFILVALKHDEVEKARTRLSIWQRIKRRHVARLKLDWDNLTYAGHHAARSHPCAIDLDLTGPRSLLHLIDTTTTVGGRKRLEQWFLQTPDFDAIPRRQKAVRALINHRRFRDRLALHGLELARSNELFDYSIVAQQSRISADNTLLDWRGKAIVACAALNLVLICVHLSGGPMWWPYSVFCYWAIYGTLISKVIQYIQHLFRVNRALSGLFKAMIWIQGYKSRLGAELDYVYAIVQTTGEPTTFKKQLDRLDSAITFSQSDITRLLMNAILPYDFLVMVAYERMLNKLLPQVEQWINALSELEALSALSTYADFQAARCTFPTLRTHDSASKTIQGMNLTHPLMPREVCIPNPVNLTKGEVGVITGSNMSGKSTYLRSVGLAALMAWSGGPVCAEHLEVSPLRVYTSMRIGDVLQDGKSTFYAEVERLSTIIQAIDQQNASPVLVLLDEILRGTNTKERLLGVHSIVTHLAGAEALSFIATHDQEITQLAAEHKAVNNYHFREHLDRGRLVFEYRLHDGPSDTTNALLIMQEAGLPIQKTE